MAVYEEMKQESKYEEQEYHYSYDDIMDDIFGFIEKKRNEVKLLIIGCSS